MRGRPPKPTVLHSLHGTTEPSRHNKRLQYEPRPEGDLVEPPKALTPEQIEGWRYALDNAPAHLMKRLDRGMLAAWVIAEDRLYRANQAQAMLDARAQLPMLITSPAGLIVSPYEQIIDNSTKRMVRLAAELGFSPAARPRIKVEQVPDKQAEDDPWSMLRVIPGGAA